MSVPTPSAAIPCEQPPAGSAGTTILSAGQLSTLSESSVDSLSGEGPGSAPTPQALARPAQEDVPALDVDSRKIVVLGIPWQTEDATLEAHFSRFGPVEEVLIMRERFSGKSRGFGFVTFASSSSARAAIASEHVVDGRRCEARLALPEGKVGSARTTRIFVARIPFSIGDAAFRAYFEQFGVVQDAYMPKDPSKQGHRGIGFVTYARAESVDAVMARSHILGGNEVAIDRATPKERGSSGSGGGLNAAAVAAAAAALPGRLSMSQPNLPLLASAGSLVGLQGLSSGASPPATASLLNGSGPPALPHAATTHGSSAVAEYLFALQQQAAFIQHRASSQNNPSPPRTVGVTPPPPSVPSATALSPVRAHGDSGGTPGLPSPSTVGSAGVSQGGPQTSPQAGIPSGSTVQGGSAFAADASPTTLSELLGSFDSCRVQQQQMEGVGQTSSAATTPQPTMHGASGGLQAVLAAQAATLHAQRMAHSASHGSIIASEALPSPNRFLSNEASLLANESSIAFGHASPHQLDVARSLSGSLWSMGSGAALSNYLGSLQSGGVPAAPASSSAAGPASARAGPRIFVGKLHRDTSEADLREYFSAFGYVLDVYLPRDRVNKRDHRGFGFVTFETDAAIQRVVAHGAHQIRGAFVAIDAAVPRQEEVVPFSSGGGSLLHKGSAPEVVGPLSSTLEGLKLSGSGVWGSR